MRQSLPDTMPVSYLLQYQDTDTGYWKTVRTEDIDWAPYIERVRLGLYLYYGKQHVIDNDTYHEIIQDARRAVTSERLARRDRGSTAPCRVVEVRRRYTGYTWKGHIEKVVWQDRRWINP